MIDSRTRSIMVIMATATLSLAVVFIVLGLLLLIFFRLSDGELTSALNTLLYLCGAIVAGLSMIIGIPHIFSGNAPGPLAPFVGAPPADGSSAATAAPDQPPQP